MSPRIALESIRRIKSDRAPTRLTKGAIYGKIAAHLCPTLICALALKRCL
jgi:hypothetical protein